MWNPVLLRPPKSYHNTDPAAILPQRVRLADRLISALERVAPNTAMKSTNQLLSRALSLVSKWQRTKQAELEFLEKQPIAKSNVF
jgi:hypothetical protein